MATWTEINQLYLDEAERRGIHVDDVHSWMLRKINQCDDCGTAQLPAGHALCDRCITAREELANSFRPEVIAARQGCMLVYSDGKDAPGPQNATTDESGKYGLHFAGGI